MKNIDSIHEDSVTMKELCIKMLFVGLLFNICGHFFKGKWVDDGRVGYALERQADAAGSNPVSAPSFHTGSNAS